MDTISEISDGGRDSAAQAAVGVVQTDSIEDFSLGSEADTVTNRNFFLTHAERVPVPTLCRELTLLFRAPTD